MSSLQITEPLRASRSNPRERIRLLWVIDSLTVGGAESLLVPFARTLDPRRYELLVCCLTTIQGNAIAAELQRENVEVVNLGAQSLRDIRAFRSLVRLVRDRDIDVMHAHLTYASTWSAAVSRMTGVPLVASLHVAPPESGKAKVRDRLMRAALDRWANAVIAVSGALRRRYVAGGGIDESKLLTVHNGIDVALFQGSAVESRAFLARELEIPSRASIIGTVSVLRPGKGIDVLLRSIPRIVEVRPDAVFVIVGDGPMKDEWTTLANELGVGACVRWAGYRNDVASLLPGCDLFVLPSLDDAFPTVLLEAMASGVPVVASNVGGVPEIVTDGTTGRLVEPGNAEALATAIVELLDQRDAMERMSDAARRDALHRFSTDAWISRLDAIYQRVISERTGS